MHKSQSCQPICLLLRSLAHSVTNPFSACLCINTPSPLSWSTYLKDIEPVLALLAKRLGKKRHSLKLWDPFFCNGRAAELLNSLGFTNVHHRNEDFYKAVVPKYDCLITNPPYSSDHKQKCLEFCASSGKPWVLLVPSYVTAKEYYRKLVLETEAHAPFYIVPEGLYQFDHPEGTGHDTSPFTGIWFVSLGQDHRIREAQHHTQSINQAIILPVHVVMFVMLQAEGVISNKKRGNPRQRKAAKKRRLDKA
ncbi:unnamed protein product [Chrysoparadoxa australica]